MSNSNIESVSERIPLAFRCEHCGRKCKNEQELKVHQNQCFRKPVNRTGSKSDKYIQKLKQSRALKSRAKVVTIGDTQISTVDEFIYLGYLLRYDGNETPNLEMRFTKANTAFSCLRKIWSNKTYLRQKLKIRVFNSIVLSVLLYASEIWTLDIKTCRSIRSWYCRKMSLITERSYRDEYVSPTIDVIQLIRIRRAKWLKLNLTYNSKSLVTTFKFFADKACKIGQKETCSLTCLMCISMHLKTNSTMIRNGKRSLNLSNLTQLEIHDQEYTHT